jgi:hypothetical protein
MVVLARLQWARTLVAGGAPAHISISSASEAGRGKFKILVFHGQPATSIIVRDLLVAQLDHVILQVRAYVAVDRGHRHVGTNASEIGIWLSPCPVPSARFICHDLAPADDDVSEGADDDGDEGDVEVDHNCNSGSSETAEHEEFAPPRLDYQAPDMSILALTGKGRGSSSAQGYTKVTNPFCLRSMGADVPVVEVSDLSLVSQSVPMCRACACAGGPGEKCLYHQWVDEHGADGTGGHRSMDLVSPSPPLVAPSIGSCTMCGGSGMAGFSKCTWCSS